MDSQTNTSGGANIGRDVNIGSGDFIGRDKVVIELSTLSKELLATLNALEQQLRSSSTSKQKVIFEQHIEPAYRKLEVVHKDYEKTFHELVQKLRAGIKSQMVTELMPELLAWVTDRSLDHRSEREYLMNIYTELDIVRDKMTQSSEATGIENLEISEAIKEFSSKTITYFTFTKTFYVAEQWGVDPILWATNRQAYMILISCIRNIDHEPDKEQLVKRLEMIHGILDDWVRSALVEYWRDVTQSYLKLRGLCLS